MVEKMMRPAEAAKLIGVSAHVIRSAIESGELMAANVSHGKANKFYLVTMSALELWQKEIQKYHAPGGGWDNRQKAVPRHKPDKNGIPAGMELDKNGNLRTARRRA